MYLELTDISKKIGADEVLSGITLSMEKGKVYGLQGKNRLWKIYAYASNLWISTSNCGGSKD